MLLSHKNFLSLLSASLITGAVHVGCAQAEIAIEEEVLSNFQEYTHQLDLAAQKFRESLEQKDSVFGLPILGNLQTEPSTVSLTKETLIKILDQNGDGEPDSPELTTFMAEHDFKIIVTKSSRDFDDMDDDDFPDEKTAQVADQGLKVDSYLTEPLRIVAEARLALLKSQASQDNEDAISELEQFSQAVAQIKEAGLSIEFVDTDDEDDDTDTTADEQEDWADYIMLSEMVLSGQLTTLFDRLSLVLDETLKRASAVSGKEYKDEDSELIPKAYLAWKKLTPETLQQLAPLMCEWLQKHKLYAPVVQLENITPVAEEISVDDLSDPEFTERTNVPSEEPDKKQPETEQL